MKSRLESRLDQRRLGLTFLCGSSILLDRVKRMDKIPDEELMLEHLLSNIEGPNVSLSVFRSFLGIDQCHRPVLYELWSETLVIGHGA